MPTYTRALETPLVVSGCNWQGCYDDVVNKALNPRVLPDDRDFMTIELCVGECLRLGYLYAGLEYGSECYCGPGIEGNHSLVYGNTSTQDIILTCSNPEFACSGNRTEMCGGYAAIGIYYCPANLPATSSWVLVTSAPESDSHAKSARSLSSLLLETTTTTYASGEPWARLSQRWLIYHRSVETSSSSSIEVALPSPTGCAGLASFGGDGATYTTPNGVVYTLYCGIASTPIFYGVREEDATSILECLADCDVDPDCGAALLLNAICYYSEQPTDYGLTDDENAILAVRAAQNPYPDETTTSSSTVSSSSSSEVPSTDDGPTT
jgi:hypothetical protein